MKYGGPRQPTRRFEYRLKPYGVHTIPHHERWVRARIYFVQLRAGGRSHDDEDEESLNVAVDVVGLTVTG